MTRAEKNVQKLDVNIAEIINRPQKLFEITMQKCGNLRWEFCEITWKVICDCVENYERLRAELCEITW